MGKVVIQEEFGCVRWIGDERGGVGKWGEQVGNLKDR